MIEWFVHHEQPGHSCRLELAPGELDPAAPSTAGRDLVRIDSDGVEEQRHFVEGSASIRVPLEEHPGPQPRKPRDELRVVAHEISQRDHLISAKGTVLSQVSGRRVEVGRVEICWWEGTAGIFPLLVEAPDELDSLCPRGGKWRSAHWTRPLPGRTNRVLGVLEVGERNQPSEILLDAKSDRVLLVAGAAKCALPTKWDGDKGERLRKENTLVLDAPESVSEHRDSLGQPPNGELCRSFRDRFSVRSMAVPHQEHLGLRFGKGVVRGVADSLLGIVLVVEPVGTGLLPGGELGRAAVLEVEGRLQHDHHRGGGRVQRPDAGTELEDRVAKGLHLEALNRCRR